MVDDRAKHLKEDRSDYMESRKFMVQKLKKDLEKMKAGLMHIDEIEKKYAFLHNDKDFQLMMSEIKREIHPGSLCLLEQSILSKKKKGKYGRIQDGVKSSMNLKPGTSPSPDLNKSQTDDKSKPKDVKHGDEKPSDPKNADSTKHDPKKEEMTEAEKSRIKKHAVAELQQKQVKKV